MGKNRALDTKIIGRSIIELDTVDSTNEKAMEQALQGGPDGTVLVAEEQTLGKGRLSRSWSSPKGGLWLSIILRPEIPPNRASRITLMAGVAVAKALSAYDLDARIKWPNDVLLNGRKVCGILSETRILDGRIHHVILGIGINANFDLEELPEEIRRASTTLRNEMGGDIPRDELLVRVLEECDRYYQILISEDSNQILEEWKKVSDTLGSKVKVITQKDAIEGLALDLDEDGALVVKTDSGEVQKLSAGDCIHVTPDS